MEQINPQSNQVTANPVPVPPKKLGSKIIIAVVALLAIAVAIGAFWFNKTRQLKQANAPTNTTVEAVTNTEPPKKEVPAGWEEFRHDVLGLAFNYPPEWGKATTAPKTSITDLKTAVEGLDETNTYFNNIHVNFGNKAPGVQIFNDAYVGQKYPNAFAQSLPPMDNIPILKQTGNICDYKINFDNPGYSRETEREIYNTCINGIKISVLETMQQFNPPTGTLYIYSLNFYSYHKLQNGTFNNLLTFLQPVFTKQSPTKLTADEFFKQTAVQLSDDKDLQTFTAFAKTIESYSPPQKPHQQFTVPANEDPDITTIRKYYYDLVQNTPKIYKATPDLFTKLGSGDYEFWVDYQEQNDEAKMERVKAKVVSGKVKQYFLDILNGPQFGSGNYLAYAASRGDKNIVLIRQGDNETIIDSAPNDFDKTLDTLVFYDVHFTAKGNYLMYSAGGWEWGFTRIYSLTKKKRVLDNSMSDVAMFNKAETLYLFCASPGMGTDFVATLYSTPDFLVKLDLIKQFPELADFSQVDCKTDDSTVTFTFSGKYDKDQNFDENAKKVFVADFNTGELLAK